MPSPIKTHGDRVEDAVEAVCFRLFGPDFVLRSPQLIEQSGSKELTDFLVVVDDTAIVMQSKSLALDISEIDQTKFGRIQKKHKEAKRQLNTTLNAHTRGARVRVKSPLNVAFDIDWSWIKKKIGIITLHLRDELYSDPEFRFQYPHLVEEHKGIIVHTFLLNDLRQMTSELSTPADVLSYLEMREKCLMSGKFQTEFMNELDFLAMFKSRYPQLERILASDFDFVGLEAGIWEEYRKIAKQRIEERDRKLKNGVVIDTLIRRFQTSINFTAERYGLTAEASAAQYFRLIGKFGKLARIERAWIGDKLLEKLEKTKRSKFGYFVHVSPRTKTAYLFLLVNESDREKRGNALNLLCVQACHSIDCTEVVGVVSEGARQQGSSIDALVLNVAEVRSTTQPQNDLTFFQQPVRETKTEWSF